MSCGDTVGESLEQQSDDRNLQLAEASLVMAIQHLRLFLPGRDVEVELSGVDVAPGGGGGLRLLGKVLT
jgi:hypothetical protein